MDIVEMLRQGTDDGLLTVVGEQCLAAADEIERLRGIIRTCAAELEKDGDELGVGFALRMAIGEVPNIDCRGCKHDQPGDCSAKTMGEDGYFHFPEGKCHTEHCGKINSGVACTMPVGSKCPDCGVSLHDFGGHD